jgi:SAM-dependent methyltransferase
MLAVTKWLDKVLYPTYEDSWDNEKFRKYLIEKIESDYFLLDYGAGRGALHEMDFRKKAKRVAGVDPDSSVLLNPFLDESKLLPLPSGEIPYSSNTFDMVFANNVMEHVQNPKIAFKEIYRVLKPNGIFVAKTPNKWHYVAMIAKMTPYSFHVFINRIRGRKAYDIFPTEYKINTKRDIKDCSYYSGFEVVNIEMWEGRPEYLRISPPFYIMGYIYERLVNHMSFLTKFRCVMVFTLRKPASSFNANE